MKFLMFAASLRAESVNKKLIQLSASIVQELGHQVDMAAFNDFDAPLYNADVQNSAGIPEAIKQFVARMHAADGVIIASPEYNFSIPGTLKNLIDWVSRMTPMPWQKQLMFLLSASPSLVGGNRGLWATRVPLEACGAVVHPDMFSLASAHESFDDAGKLKSQPLQQRLSEMIKTYILFTEKLRQK